MTERLYYSDSSLLDFEAKVVETGPHDNSFYTVLNRSAFYPTSGGQPHDSGTLNGVAVRDVIESESGDVRHLTDSEVGAVGQSVVGLVDKERRFKNCRNHTAQHILSAAFTRLFDYETMSVHLGDEYGAVELEARTIADDQLRQVEAMANGVIADNVEIEPIFADSDKIATLPLRKPPKREGKLRIIRIGQFDFVACGGTHCSTSGGVGLVKITGTEKIRGRTLVRFLAGPLAVADYVLRFEATDQLARSFTCHPTDLVSKVEKLAGDHRELRKTLTEAQKELLPMRAKELVSQATQAGKFRITVADAGGLDPSNASRLAVMAADELEGMAALVAGGRLVLAVAETTELHAGDLAREIGSRHSLKGGGNNRTAQLGDARTEELDKYLATIRTLLENG